MSRLLIEDFDGFAPGGRLRRADVAQIQDVALHHPPALETLILDDAPVAVESAKPG
jgi:hypothetical protein